MYEVPFEWVLSKVPRILMMSDYREDLDDFPTHYYAENINRLADSLVGGHRAESTNQWTAGNGITTKIPPLTVGSSSWFKQE